jgi:hypothetical protein
MLYRGDMFGFPCAGWPAGLPPDLKYAVDDCVAVGGETTFTIAVPAYQGEIRVLKNGAELYGSSRPTQNSPVTYSLATAATAGEIYTIAFYSRYVIVAKSKLDAPTDPLFSQVFSLLPGNGPNLGTSFPDVTGRTWTLNSGSVTTTSTAQSKWGGSSILIGSSTGSGTVAGIQTAHDSAFNFWNGSTWNPTTGEWWEYPTSFANYTTNLSYGNTGTGALLLQPIPTSGEENVYVSGLFQFGEATANSLNTWVHKAFCIDPVNNGVFYYRAGVLTASYTLGSQVAAMAAPG